jgi:hypothetical protein
VLGEYWDYQPSLSRCRFRHHQTRQKYQEYLASSFAKIYKVSRVVHVCTKFNEHVSVYVLSTCGVWEGEGVVI